MSVISIQSVLKTFVFIFLYVEHKEFQAEERKVDEAEKIEYKSNTNRVDVKALTMLEHGWHANELRFLKEKYNQMFVKSKPQQISNIFEKFTDESLFLENDAFVDAG